MKIPLCRPVFTEEMRAAALDALENEFFVMGESVYKFEEEFARYIGTKYAVSVSSGTSALSLSLAALGLKRDEKVLTTPMSFIATSNAVFHAGGVPAFSDIEADTGNIDAQAAAAAAKGARGIIPVHLYGNFFDVEKIMELRENGFFVIEDACQAHGAEWNGRKAGSFGDAGCFSFYSTKNMTVCGDGGMVTTDSEEIAEKLRVLRDCGRISRYEHSVVGYTARLNTVNAAIGRVQLKNLDTWNEKRRHAAGIYRKRLPQEILLRENGRGAYHIFAVQSANRDAIMRHLEENGIVYGIHYPVPLHLQKAYETLGHRQGDYPVAEKFSRQALSLPMFPGITKDEVDFVCEKVMEVIP